MFGCAPEVLQEVMAEYRAFSERVGVEAALRPLDEAYVRHLVVAYLDQGHTELTDEIEPPPRRRYRRASSAHRVTSGRSWWRVAGRWTPRSTVGGP